MVFWVEVYRPAYPAKGIKYRVYKEKEFLRDVVDPGMTGLFRVENVTTKPEALAACLEKLAGKPVTVYPA